MENGYERFTKLLGRAALDVWGDMPRDIQEALVETAMKGQRAEREELARLLHGHHPRGRKTADAKKSAGRNRLLGGKERERRQRVIAKAQGRRPLRPSAPLWNDGQRQKTRAGRSRKQSSRQPCGGRATRRRREAEELKVVTCLAVPLRD
jgi:hypothetical protein